MSPRPGPRKRQLAIRVDDDVLERLDHLLAVLTSHGYSLHSRGAGARMLLLSRLEDLEQKLGLAETRYTVRYNDPGHVSAGFDTEIDARGRFREGGQPIAFVRRTTYNHFGPDGQPLCVLGGFVGTRFGHRPKRDAARVALESETVTAPVPF